MLPSGSELAVPLKLTETDVRIVPLVNVKLAVGILSCNWIVFVAFPEFAGDVESVPDTVTDHKPPGSLPGVYVPRQKLRVESKTNCAIVSLCPPPENRRNADAWPD
jgi:hypothetical protein